MTLASTESPQMCTSGAPTGTLEATTLNHRDETHRALTRAFDVPRVEARGVML